MDPIGLAVGVAGLAGLFSVCLDVINKVDSYKDFEADSRSIIAQFEADKHLFRKWSRDVGIDKIKPHNNYQNELDNPETYLIVQKILLSVQEIFSKTDGAASHLQPILEAGPTSFPHGIHFLKTRRNAQLQNAAISKRDRIGWSLRNKVRFVYQVQQFGALVQRLNSLVPPIGQSGPANIHTGTASNDLSSNEEKAGWFSYSQRLLAEVEEQIEYETRKELNAWVGASWTNDVYDKFVRTRLDGTCSWILSRQVFTDWMSSNFPSETAKILWINGPAGYGKTILCAKVIQYLSMMLESPLAYYFCSSDSESRRNPLTIMRSWVAQMISRNQGAFEMACSRWEAKDGRQASQTDIFELFKHIVQHTPNCTFIVDGIDECAWAEEKWKSNGDDSPIGFFKSIKETVMHTTTRVLILSRDESDIRYGFRTTWTGESNQSFKEYQIRPDDVRSDASLFSRSIVDKRLANKNDTLRYELSQRMVDRCEGMFLWMKMLEEPLRSWKNKKQLEETIDHAPTELDRLYDRDWIKISHLPDRERLRAFSLLRWAAFALRSLTIHEIAEALLVIDDDVCEELLDEELPDAIDEDYINSEILGPCGSLLEIQKTTPEQDLGSVTVHLTHFSVKQYIICNMPTPRGLLLVNRRLDASNETFHRNVLAKLCLRYLNFQKIWNESLQVQSSPVKRSFRDYAATFWHQHISKDGSNYEQVIELTKALFSRNNSNWDSWRKWFDANDDKSNMPESQRGMASTSPLFYASLLGLQEVVVHLIVAEQVDSKYTDRSNWTAVQAAALKGHLGITKLLFESGADMKITTTIGWTPLNLASDSGHIEVVKLLLEKGADITIANTNGWTPLNLASDSGHIEVVKLLLEKGADITIANTNGWTPLNSASDSGHIEVVKLLLEKGADITIANTSGWTPLNLASNRGHIEVVKLLLEKGADMTIADTGRWTPLNLASDSGHIEVVKLLLEKGADMTIADTDGWTPLNSASYSGQIEVVKLLLEKGADMTIANTNGRTPLYSALDSGHVEVVKLLLDKGADWSVASDGWTPLNSASYSGHVEVVKLLLDKGADWSVATSNGWAPLNSASYRGHVEVVKLLLDKGANIMTRDLVGRSVLFFAIKSGNFKLFTMLVHQALPLVDSRDHFGSSVLSVASRFGHEEMVQLLTSLSSTTLASRDDFGRTALWWAQKQNHARVMEHIIHSAEEFGVSIPDPVLPVGSPAQFGGEWGWCDVCMASLEDRYYECAVCLGGGFAICVDCESLGAHCLVESHVLKLENQEKGVDGDSHRNISDAIEERAS